MPHLPKKNTDVRYLFKDQIVMEMAPRYFGLTGVEKGVLISFPIEAFEDLEHYSLFIDALRHDFPESS